MWKTLFFALGNVLDFVLSAETFLVFAEKSLKSFESSFRISLGAAVECASVENHLNG